MTIPEIKTALPITTVLAHYGLEPSSAGAMKCPFHADASASMKIYPTTNTAFCFAGSCDIQSVDAIDFILHMEKCDKRAAILRAKELCGAVITESIKPASAPGPAAEQLDVTAIYAASLETMKKHAAAKAYCISRGLKFREFLGTGYKSRKTAEKWGRGSIILPLRNAGGKTVSL